MVGTSYQLAVDIKHQLTLAQGAWQYQSMVDRERSKEEFADRLNLALDEAEVRAHGRGVDIRTELIKRGAKVTTQAVSKWLKGESAATGQNLLALCSWLNVRPEWLEYGIKPMRHDSIGERRGAYGPNVEPAGQPYRTYSYPVISWVQAGEWAEAPDNFQPGDGESWEESSVNAGAHGFWLKVRGDSMTSPNGITFPDGMLILVRPEMDLINGKFYVGKLLDTGETTFKQLILDSGRKYFRPLNPTYRTIEINGNCTIVGRVVDARWPG
ncbi:LexA family protein, partial [Pseudomonas sp. EggHat1]|uniref:LexA family protein n=1 Tax=Pseudomonas sp. EggHat1 TaxID=2761624 RepID=UPI001868643D